VTRLCSRYRRRPRAVRSPASLQEREPSCPWPRGVREHRRARHLWADLHVLGHSRHLHGYRTGGQPGLSSTTTITQTQVGYGITLAAVPSELVAGGKQPIAPHGNRDRQRGSGGLATTCNFALGTPMPSGTVCGTVPTLAGTPGVRPAPPVRAAIYYTPVALLLRASADNC